MNKNKKDNYLKEKITELAEENKEAIINTGSPTIRTIRKKAMERFKDLGFPGRSVEEWRNTNLEDALSYDYDIVFHPEEEIHDIEKVFKCDVPHLNTMLLPLLNGFHVYKEKALNIIRDGVIVGSFAQAIKEYPEIVQKHFSKYSDTSQNGFEAINTAIAQDGIFIYVPDGVEVKTPIQIVNIIRRNQTYFCRPET